MLILKNGYWTLNGIKIQRTERNVGVVFNLLLENKKNELINVC